MQAECTECHAHYQVKQDLAGHLVKCRQCGRRFRVAPLSEATAVETIPAPAQVAAPAPALAEAGPNLEGYEELAKEAPAAKGLRDQPAIALPESASEVWIPLGVAFLSYGLTICLAIETVATSDNAGAAGILLAMLALAYLGVVMPFVAYMARTTCRNLKIERPGSIVLQNAAICSLPLVGMTIGLLASNRPVAGIVWGGLIAGMLLFLLVPCIWQSTASKSAQAVVLLFTAFTVAAGGSILVVLLLLSLILPPLDMEVPWKPAAKPAAVQSPAHAAPPKAAAGNPATPGSVGTVRPQAGK